MLLLIQFLLLLPLFCVCFCACSLFSCAVLSGFFLALQSSHLGREDWLFYINCLLMSCDSWCSVYSSWCRGLD